MLVGPDYLSCLNELQTIRDRWLNARSREFTHEAKRISSAIRRQRRDRTTLVLAGVTALTATLVPILGEKNQLVMFLTIGAAILTGVSKVHEQMQEAKEDDSRHATATTQYSRLRERLMKLVVQHHNYARGKFASFDMTLAEESLNRIGQEIDRLFDGHPIVVDNASRQRAEAELRDTTILNAISDASRASQRPSREDRNLGDLR